MATIICLYGVCYTLINVTFAVKSMPIDTHFDDINFYKCVIDEYNMVYETKLDYDDMMDYSKLNKLKSLSCNNKDLMHRDKITSIRGIELMSSLEELSLVYTNLTSINLSGNGKIKNINLEGNILSDTLYVYNGEKVNLNKGVRLSNNFINHMSWTNQNEDVVEVMDNNIVYGKKNGFAIVSGKSDLGYNVINNVHVVSIYSLKYGIDNEYIYIDNMKSFDISDIGCTDDNVMLELYYGSMELYVKYNDNVLKKFILVERDA